MSERRLTKIELRVRRIIADEPEQERRGIFELFREAEQEQPDEDAPLVREGDETVA